MTYSTFDLTKHTQMAIRGPTGELPDSEFTFSVYSEAIEVSEMAPLFAGRSDMYMSDAVDWERAVQMAKWILEWDEAFKRKVEE